MDIYIFTTKIIFTGRLAETLKIQARNSIEAMQAYDYIRSKTTQKEKLFHPVSRNKNSFSEEEQKKKKERKTIPKFRYVRNKNRRKKKDKEKEREKDYAYREQIPDFVRCYRAGVTWCSVARLLRSQSPRKSTPRTTARETRGVCEWTTISTSQIVGTNERTNEGTRWDRLQGSLFRVCYDRWIDDGERREGEAAFVAHRSRFAAF